MRARTFVCFVLSIAACSAPNTNPTRPLNGASGSAGSAGMTSQAGAAGNAVSASGSSGVAGSAGESTGVSGSVGNSAGSGGSIAGSDNMGGASSSAGGGMNMVPATYTGTPFKALTIPGIIYAADYDKGGSGVAFCRVGAANPPTPATCMTAKLDDWCCSPKKGCDERAQANVCPIYRADADNAGLSHLNTGEPDNYAATSPTWVDGPSGPTLTGPMVTAGSAVPSHMDMTTVDDTYISYMFTGQWQQYTVQVAAAGSYSIGGVFASPGAT
ncbi:MAG TPA: hypothetical protein VHV51_25320, partial [Polyangiaceae bacterium]|nr:hypothetical protein [Polyangiaceae bacterium]